MNSTGKTPEQLAAENEELRARLEEMEETLRAISSGEVDALVVPGVGGEQIFTLKGAEYPYRLLIEGMHDGAALLTADGLILYANHCVAEMLKAPLEKVIGSAITEWMAPDSQTIMQALLRESGSGNRSEQRLILAASDGTQVQVNASVSMPATDDMPAYINLVMTDLTEITAHMQAEASAQMKQAELQAQIEASQEARWELLSVSEDLKQAENELRVSAQRYQLLFESSRDALMTLAPPSWKFTGANQAALQLFGASSVAEFTMLGPWDVSPERQPDGRLSSEKAPEMIATAMREGSHFFEWEHQRLDGRRFAADVLLARMEVGGEVFLQATVRDISERKQAEEKINNLAFYDALTQLPNRRLLNDRLGQSMAASKRSGRYGALMFLDLDNFKPLNDTYGHGVGDLLLIEAARRIAGCVREVGAVACFGGDEFVVLLNELDMDKAESTSHAKIVAEKIRATLAEPYLLTLQQEGKAETAVEHHCTSSIGVVLFISHEGSPEEIIKWADMAMYQAKDAGRNLIRFYDLKI